MSSKKIVQHPFHSIDLTSLYAYTDESQLRDRELWRGFLSCILPSVFAGEVEDIDEILSTSTVDSVDDLQCSNNIDNLNPIHLISAHIAESIGVSREFALASFYNNEYSGLASTKLYKFHHIPVKNQLKSVQEDKMITGWLSKFNEVCTDKKFLFHVETWKDWLK